jgi:hypothetical protein
MVATASVCLAFGGLRLLKQSEFLEVRLANKGHRGVKVRGRFVRVLGPPDVPYSFASRISTMTTTVPAI